MPSGSETKSPTPDKSRLHVLVVSFPAFGHIVPLLELARKISQFHAVTFAVSAGKIHQMTQRELIGKEDTIELFGIQDGVVDDFDNLAATSNHTAMGLFFQTVYGSFAKMLNEMPTKLEVGSTNGISKVVDVVIIVNFAGSQAPICRQRGVPYYLFNPENALLLQNILTINEDSPIVSDEEADPFWRLAEPGGPPVPVTKMLKELFMPLRKTMHLANGIIVNSFREIELETLQEVQKNESITELSIHCVGPLFPEEKTTNLSHLETEKKVVEWLDRQEPNSVVYVSFGSIVAPTADQVKIIGQALLALKRPFVWSLRKHLEFLPEELAASTTSPLIHPESKFLVLPWAPQKLILGHSCVAVFMSHCGWNSTLEGLSGGKPMVAWPMFVDQLLNAQLITRLGAGVMVPGTGIKSARIVPVEEIEETIKNVAGWNTYKDAKNSDFSEVARTWGKRISTTWTTTGSSYQEFMDLVKFRHLNL